MSLKFINLKISDMKNPIKKNFASLFPPPLAGVGSHLIHLSFLMQEFNLTTHLPLHTGVGSHPTLSSLLFSFFLFSFRTLASGSSGLCWATFHSTASISRWLGRIFTASTCPCPVSRPVFSKGGCTGTSNSRQERLGQPGSGKVTFEIEVET